MNVYSDNGDIEVACDGCLEHSDQSQFVTAILPAIASVRVPESVHPDGIMDVCELHMAMIGSFLTFVDEVAAQVS